MEAPIKIQKKMKIQKKNENPNSNFIKTNSDYFHEQFKKKNWNKMRRNIERNKQKP